LIKRQPIDPRQLTDRDVFVSFYGSQLFLLIVAIAGSLFFVPQMRSLFSFSFFDVVILGAGSGVVIALLEVALERLVPETWLDDGGINRRVFQAFSYKHMVLALVLVAFIEEMLFRGVIQTCWGLVVASFIFAFVHIRYLKKPLMFLMALLLGFYLGWLYKYTGSLLPSITTHFIIDVLLGFVLKKTTASKIE